MGKIETIDLLFWIILSTSSLLVIILSTSKDWAFDVFGTNYYLLPTQKNITDKMFRIMGILFMPIGIAYMIYAFDSDDLWSLLFYGLGLFGFVLELGMIYQFQTCKISERKIYFSNRIIKISEIEKIEIWDNVIVFHTESGNELDFGIHAYPKKYQQETVKKLFGELESIAKTYRIELINNSDWSELTNPMMK